MTYFKTCIEVPLLLIFFAFMLSESVKTNLIIFRTCYVTLGYNKSECILLGSKTNDDETNRLEKIVQPYAAIITMATSVTENFCSAILCLFVGPWSDKFGRRIMLILPLLGYTLGYLLYVIFASLENLSPWYLAICIIPVVLTGGTSSYLTVLFSYITDITHERNRGMRMGVFEGVLGLGIFLGSLSSSYMFSATSYTLVFLMSAVCCFLALIITIFFISESLTVTESEGRMTGLFQLSNIVEMVKTTFKKRQNYKRLTVLSCVLMLTIYITVINGEGSVIFYYLREKFHWSLRKYTFYSAVNSILWIFGTLVGIYLIHNLLKIPESLMILVGYISMMNGHLVLGLAKTDLGVYMGTIFRSLGAVISPMVRSLVSKIIPNEEVGKIFALIVASESLFGIIGSPIYTEIYNSTIKTDPSIFNYVTAGVYFFEVLIAVVIIISRSVQMDPYTELVGPDCEEVSI